MKIAVISDLHLGRGDRTDRFGHDDAEFLRFLGFLEQEFERIVLLGDVWETLSGRFPGRPRIELATAQAAHPELARRLAGPRYDWVHGNHDIVAGRLGLAPEELIYEADGLRLLFMHGHRYDLLRGAWRRLAEMGSWLGAWIARVGLAPVYAAIERLDYWLGGSAFDPGSRGFERWAVDLAGHRGADVVVTGNTHKAGLTDHGARLFLNSGSCMGGRTTFLHLDTRTATFGLARGY